MLKAKWSSNLSDICAPRFTHLWWAAAAGVFLPACSGGDDAAPAAAASPPAAVAVVCDDTMKTAFKPDANTTVTFVKAFKQGDPLALAGTPASPPPPVAASDVCLVKLNVGPGNPGPAGAPSTSAGVGVEVWLPSTAQWNGRNRNVGDGGYAGSAAVSSLTELRSDIAGWATERKYVSSISDSGHVNQVGVSAGAFAMNPDRSVNTVLWNDLSTRALHELADKTKALAAAYYGKLPAYSYYAGCSGGGALVMPRHSPIRGTSTAFWPKHRRSTRRSSF